MSGIGGCSKSSVSGAPYCPAQGYSTSKQGHWPNHIRTSTPYTHTNCTDGGNAYYAWNLNGTSWGLGGLCATTRVNDYPGYTNFGSVRCVGFRMKYRAGY